MVIRTRFRPDIGVRLAICEGCDRDASETRITRYCISALPPYPPLLCDECWKGQ